jgi:predicted nucleic acid-binding protein
VDTFQARFSPQFNRQLAGCDPWHCSVVESELVYLCGCLDPAHPNTSRIVGAIEMAVGKWPSGRVLNPDREIWREAAILTGIVSRLHRSKAEDRGRLMNDALIFLTAVKHGCAVLTRNVRDFDLLMQLVPAGLALFYRAV